MPSGNFARGLLPFLPGIANTLSESVASGPERERRKRLAGALAPGDPGADAVPVGGDPMIDLGPGAVGPMSTPEQGEMARIGQNMRRPETVEDLLAEGHSPANIIDLFKALSPEQQPDFQRFFEEQKMDYFLRGPEFVQPEILPYIEADLPGAPKPFDPTSISSLPEARIRGAQGLIDKEQLAAIEAAQPQPEPFDEYGQIKSRTDAQRARLNNKISQERLAQYEAIFPEEAPKPGEPGGPEKPETQADKLARINEVQQKADKERRQLEDELYEIIDITQWKALSEEARAAFKPHPEDQTMYYRLRDNPPDDKVARLREVNAYLQDFEAQKRGADSLKVTLDRPAEGAGMVTPEQMAAELQAAGYEDATPDYPRLKEAYEAWKAQNAVR